MFPFPVQKMINRSSANVCALTLYQIRCAGEFYSNDVKWNHEYTEFQFSVPQNSLIHNQCESIYDVRTLYFIKRKSIEKLKV